jgi:hypothetical protein
MENQYELELDENKADVIQNYYIDQSLKNGGVVSSVYTPHGIKAIDSQFCQLILNIHNKVKQVYRINRRKYEDFCEIKTREVHMSFHYKTFYDPIEKSSCNGYFEIRLEWDNGHYYDFLYGRTPVFDSVTGNTNPEQLRKAIKECPNLHVMIKENLLGNLECFTRE